MWKIVQGVNCVWDRCRTPLPRNAPPSSQIQMNYCFRGISDTSFEVHLVKSLGTLVAVAVGMAFRIEKDNGYFTVSLGHTCGLPWHVFCWVVQWMRHCFSR